jgi:PAS domain S-box-containing protein
VATILIADDRPLNRQYLATLLGYFGHQVLEAGEGAEALRLAETHPPNLLITDLIMPGIDGKELAAQFHANPKLAGTPVIFYSATYSVPQAEAVARSVGAFGVLPKPSDPELILRLVNQALGNSAAPAPSPPPSSAAPEGQIFPLAGALPTGLAEIQAISYRLSALIEMSLELASEGNSERLLAGLAYAARKLIPAQQTMVGLLTENGQAIRLLASLSAPGTKESQGRADYETHVVALPPPGSLLKDLLEKRHPLRLKNVSIAQSGLAAPWLPEGDRVSSLLAVPLKAGSRFLGWLVMAEKIGAEEFSAEDARVAATLAAQGAIAYERLQEREQAQQALSRSKAMFEALFEFSPDALIATGEDGCLNRMNAQAERLFGYAREELLGRSVEALLPQRFRPGHSKYREGYYAEPRVRPMGLGPELFARRKDGTEFPVDIMLSPLTTEAGTLVLSAVRDITARKEAEARILRLNEELGQRVNELQVANQSLEAFSYSVSHDLRAPLRAIAGFASLLVQDHEATLDEEGKRLLSVITSNARRMGSLIEDLLSFARVSRTEIRKSELDMMALAQSVVEEVRVSEPSRQVAITVQPMPNANGDPALLRQVYTNLISNAWKFTRRKADAIIEVGSYPNGERNVYFVKDNGAGFDEEYAHKLFGVFQRLHTEQEFEGTGIGLALVSRIIQRHGGHAWASGKMGEGATFYFTV